MAPDEPDNRQWQQCPSGQIGRMMERVRRRRRMGQWRQSAALVCMFFVVIAAGIFTVRQLRSPGEMLAGGLHCSDCRKLAEPYITGRLHEKDPEQARQVAQHLETCANCSEYFEQKQQELLPDPASSIRRRPAVSRNSPGPGRAPAVRGVFSAYVHRMGAE